MSYSHIQSNQPFPSKSFRATTYRRKQNKHLYKGADKEGIFIKTTNKFKRQIFCHTLTQSKQPFPFKSFRETINRLKLNKHL